MAAALFAAAWLLMAAALPIQENATTIDCPGQFIARDERANCKRTAAQFQVSP